MNEIKTLIDIMLDTLKRKHIALNLISDMTLKQTNLIQSQEYDESQMGALVGMKQTQIDKIGMLDDGFVSTFDRVKIHLNHQPDLYADDIRAMKKAIKNIGEIGISIQVNEMRNKRLLDIKKATEGKKIGDENGAPSSNQLAKNQVNAYSKYKKNKGSE